MGRLTLAEELERHDDIDAAIAGVEQVIEAFGFELFRPAVLRGRDRAAELRGDFEQAVGQHHALLDLEPTRNSARVGIGRALRGLNRLEEAEQELTEALRIQPFAPRTNLEMALVLIEMGRAPDALEHLQRPSQFGWTQIRATGGRAWCARR